MGYSLKKAVQDLDYLINEITNLEDKIRKKNIKNMMPDFFGDEKNQETNKQVIAKSEYDKILNENNLLKEKILKLENDLEALKKLNNEISKDKNLIENESKELKEALIKVSEYMGIVIEGIEEKI